jgi:hypothetical protein
MLMMGKVGPAALYIDASVFAALIGYQQNKN